jgi:cytochrome P450
MRAPAFGQHVAEERSAVEKFGVLGHTVTMTSSPTVSTFGAVSAALHDSRLEPPAAPATIGCGATAVLRGSMARFSTADSHGPRRQAVIEAIGSLDFAVARAVSFEHTTHVLIGARVDAVRDIAFRVPTGTMLTLLGLSGDMKGLIADVGAVANVIGHGFASTPESDEAADRLLATFEPHQAGAIPAVSMLYQNYDATAALLIETLLARHRHSDRAAAVTRTTRVAVAHTTIDGVPIPAGTVVVLGLAGAGLEFGAGDHACPGRQLAEAIVDGIVSAIDTAGFEIVDQSSTLDANARPVSIVIGART